MSTKNDIANIAGRSLNESFNTNCINKDAELITEFVAMLYGDIAASRANKTLNESFSKETILIERVAVPFEERGTAAKLQDYANFHKTKSRTPFSDARDAIIDNRDENNILNASKKLSAGKVGGAQNELGKLSGLSGVNTPESIGDKITSGDWVASLGNNVTGGLQNAGKSINDMVTKNWPDLANNPAFAGIKEGGKGILNTMAANPSMVTAGLGLAALLLVAPKIFKGFRKMRAKGMLKKLNARRSASNLQPIPIAALNDPKAFIDKYKSGELG